MLIDLLKIKKTGKISHQIIQSVFVGVIAGVVDFGFLFIFTEYAKIYYLLSNALSFLIAVTVNYILSSKMIFWSGRYTTRKEIILFVTLSAIGLLLNELIMYMLVERVEMFYMYSKIFSTILVFCWNFWSRKKIIFLK